MSMDDVEDLRCINTRGFSLVVLLDDIHMMRILSGQWNLDHIQTVKIITAGSHRPRPENSPMEMTPAGSEERVEAADAVEVKGFDALGLTSLIYGGFAAEFSSGIVVRTASICDSVRVGVSVAESRSGGIVVETSWRSFGSIVSDGADLKGGVLHNMELRIERAAVRFSEVRDYLTTWVELFEATKKECELFLQIPPMSIVWHHDLLERAWGWERLFPTNDLRYLEEYYRRNAEASTGRVGVGDSRPHLEKKVTGSTKSDAITAGQQEDGSANDSDYLVTLVNSCFDKEIELASEWMKERLPAAPEIKLSIRIQEKALSLLLQKKDRRIIPDVIHDCFKCITKEAELILEQLRKGFVWCDFDIKFSHEIRTQVFRLVQKYLRADPWSASVPTRAVLLGITKEAELICKKLRQEGSVRMAENGISRTIRSRAVDTLMNSNLDKVARKRCRTGFCYWHYLDPAAIDIPTCWRKVYDLTEGDGVQTSGLPWVKENDLTKTELEENVRVYDLTDGVWRKGHVSTVEYCGFISVRLKNANRV
ncbi:hypothetical protein U9M48_037172 [Paspalum notatum var. saurae]|uniref:Uncharacterized protein n=1 Tax=Paspalum notatum var. saurae TaxID=547442 RepID=A0AAQ3UIK9_PASNO